LIELLPFFLACYALIVAAIGIVPASLLKICAVKVFLGSGRRIGTRRVIGTVVVETAILALSFLICLTSIISGPIEPGGGTTRVWIALSAGSAALYFFMALLPNMRLLSVLQNSNGAPTSRDSVSAGLAFLLSIPTFVVVIGVAIGLWATF
jgi:hypothetical protein